MTDMVKYFEIDSLSVNLFFILIEDGVQVYHNLHMEKEYLLYKYENLLEYHSDDEPVIMIGFTCYLANFIFPSGGGSNLYHQ
jgi:hypothetical protein